MIADQGVFDRFLSEVTLDFPGINFRYVGPRVAPVSTAFKLNGPPSQRNFSYLREYVSLGTGGGLHHFRDEVLRGNPDCGFPWNFEFVWNTPD